MPRNHRSNSKCALAHWSRSGLLAFALGSIALAQLPPAPRGLPDNSNNQRLAGARPARASAFRPQAGNSRRRPTGPPTTYGGVNLDNVSLTEVIDMLARQLKINYILDPRVKGGVILNTYGETKNIDPKSLLEAILRINGAGMVQGRRPLPHPAPGRNFTSCSSARKGHRFQQHPRRRPDHAESGVSEVRYFRAS